MPEVRGSNRRWAILQHGVFRSRVRSASYSTLWNMSEARLREDNSGQWGALLQYGMLGSLDFLSP